MLRKLILLILLMSSLAAAQTVGFYTDRALGVNPFTPGTGGVPSPIFLSYAQVRVCTLPLTLGTPCPTPAAITDIFGNPISIIGGNFGQLTTDVVGRFSFGCGVGLYQIQIAPTGSNTPQLAYPITCPTTGTTNFGFFAQDGPNAVGFNCANGPFVGSNGKCLSVGQLAVSGINIKSQRISFNGLDGGGSNVTGNLQFDGASSGLIYSVSGGAIPQILAPGFEVLVGGSGFGCQNDPLTPTNGICMAIGQSALSGNSVQSQYLTLFSTNSSGTGVKTRIYSGVGVPSNATCSAAGINGGLYIRTDGAASTTLYVCDSTSQTWGPVSVP